MRLFARLTGLIAILLLGLVGRAATNNVYTNIFGVGIASNPTNTALVGQTVVYTIDVTNNAPGTLGNIFISNSLPSSSRLVGVGANIGTLQTSGSAQVLTVLALGSGQVVVVSITNVPTQLGTLTDLVTVYGTGTTNVSATNVLSAVTGNADLGVTWSSIPTGALSYDLISLALTVTNAGPSSAANPVVNITFPAGLTLLGVQSSASTVNPTNNLITLSLPSLSAAGNQKIQFNFQPTNDFTNSLTAKVSSVGLSDTNSNNDTASATLVVAPPPAGAAALTVLTTNAVLNLQTGLLEEIVRVTNTGTTTNYATRITVLGETNVVSNATGTNGFDPFVTIISPLAPQQSVDCVLEYNFPRRQLSTLPSLIATPVLTPQQTLPTGTEVPISRWAVVSTNRFLLEFAATLGSKYTVEYSDQPTFAVVQPVVPSLVAGADRVQWIDHGPPNTAALGTAYLLQLTNVVATNTTVSGTNVTTYVNVPYIVFTNSTVTPSSGLILATNIAPRFYRVLANP